MTQADWLTCTDPERMLGDRPLAGEIMSERVIGYCVRVCDCAPDGWHGEVKVLHEQEFLARQEDSPGYQLGNALLRAETHAQHLEQHVWPGHYVEVEPIWREVQAT